MTDPGTGHRVLVAEDDRVSRRILETRLEEWGFNVVSTTNGEEAWQALQQPDAPPIAILDWQMPGLDGVDVCRKVRGQSPASTTYLILLTTRDAKSDMVQGLEAGADDYVVKPFDPAELRARLRVGSRVAALQADLARQVVELRVALAQVAQLQGLVPICMYCKRVRDDRDYWQQVETYMERVGAVEISHQVCPECFEKVLRPRLDSLRDTQS
jgi:CheY-like chemotaxis protein